MIKASDFDLPELEGDIHKGRSVGPSTNICFVETSLAEVITRNHLNDMDIMPALTNALYCLQSNGAIDCWRNLTRDPHTGDVYVEVKMSYVLEYYVIQLQTR